MVYSAFDISQLVICYIRSNYIMNGISNLRLQKLLYFIQAGFLITKGKPCFSSSIEAWDFGPVVPWIYERYEYYNIESIPRDILCTPKVWFKNPKCWITPQTKLPRDFVSAYIQDQISKDDRELIYKIVDKFAPYDTHALMKITQNQKPWKEAFVPGERNTITIQSILDYFQEGDDLMNVRVKRLNENAKLPTYATDGSACFDLYACEDVTLPVLSTKKVPLGLAFEVPKGHVMLLFPRSSTGLNTPLRMSNSVGVIDSDYRGEVCCLYDNEGVNSSYIDHRIRKGDRIAQGMIIPVEQVSFLEVDGLSETERGNGGFGSTGV